MKRVLFFSILTGCLATASLTGHAQSSKSKPAADDALHFGISIEPALPLGDFKEVSKFGFGFNGLVKYSISDKLALKGSLGYMTFISKTITYSDDDGSGNIQTISIKAPAVHGVPLRAGASYNLSDNIFVQGSIGLSFINNNVGTAFLYTPGIGYHSGPIEALLKYEAWSKNGTLSFIGIHVGYYF